MIKQAFFGTVLTLSLGACSPHTEQAYNLIVGCATDSTGNGILVYRFDANEGGVKLLHSIKGIDNPSFQTISADNKMLYTFSEQAMPKAEVYAYHYHAPEGGLSLFNQQSVKSDAPCYIWTDIERTALLTANYGGGSLSLFPIKADGSIAPCSQLIEFGKEGAEANAQNSSHLHAVYLSPDKQYLFANDLGRDCIYKFEVLREQNQIVGLKVGKPAYFQTPRGDGPRHSAFHPNGKYLYTLGELSGRVSLYNYQDGNLAFVDSFEADSLQASASADIHISPDGRFLYASNRLKGDGIAIFSIDAQSGRLCKRGYQLTGRHPRNFALSPDGNFLLCANRDDNQIEVFRVNKSSGMLRNTHQDISIERPVCLQFTTVTP
ncbi:MAG: lactonase family protein [Bacteroidales bacterium]